MQVFAGTRQGNDEKIYISYPRLLQDVRPGARILLDDGLLSLKVIRRGQRSLTARVIEGGTLRDHKGVNLPDTPITARSFTQKDRRDLEAGIRLGVDYVAVSFVRTAGDITKVRSYLKRRDLNIPLVAKIERPEAIENIDAIIEASDVIMVARGDLGVELPAEDVPLLQKQIIEKSNLRGRPVITATQMLESMTEHSRPTRAEVADVANAVLDGSDALMLSAETSAGKFPVESLRMMDRIIRKAESSGTLRRSYRSGDSYSEAVALAAREAASAVRARYIVAFTLSGYTARLTSSFRPVVPVLAFTPDEAVVRRMRLYWGVEPMMMKELKSTDEVFRELDRILIKKRLARRGENVVITLSTPAGIDGKTNMMKIHRVGEAG